MCCAASATTIAVVPTVPTITIAAAADADRFVAGNYTMKAKLFALACAAASAGAAHAEPGGTSNVYGPSVSEGESELEYRAAYFGGGALDGTLLHRAEAGYAFTDWWRPALVVKATDAPDASPELSALAIENVFDFTVTRSWPVHFGSYVEYAFGQNGRDDAIEFKLLAERRQGPLTMRLNLIAERPIGGASEDWEHAYAARATWRPSRRWAVGVEGFGEPEARVHYWGPRASFYFDDASIAVAYLAGSDEAAADGQLRIALELEH